MVVQDPAELDLPALGLVDLQDSESGAVMTVDSSSPEFRKAYRAHIETIRTERERELRQANIDRVEVVSGEDFIEPLIAYFRKKNARR